MKRLLRIAVFVCSAASTAPVIAQDFNAGVDAYNAGDFQTAFENWHPLAEQGNAVAQGNLALMYANGEGVLQDNVIAHMWLNIASANGDAQGVEKRDRITKRMTREQMHGIELSGL